jgi:rubredoxin
VDGAKKNKKKNEKCPVCSLAHTVGPVGRAKHMASCHVPGGFRCAHCPCSFASVGAMRCHSTMIHGDARKKVNKVAVDGGQSSGSLSGPQLVVGGGGGANKNKCGQCGYTFTRSKGLKRHLLVGPNLSPL